MELTYDELELDHNVAPGEIVSRKTPYSRNFSGNRPVPRSTNIKEQDSLGDVSYSNAQDMWEAVGKEIRSRRLH